MSREVDVADIREAVRGLAARVCITLGERETAALERSLADEPYEPAREVLAQLLRGQVQVARGRHGQRREVATLAGYE